jgi:hypothetical protein
MMRYCPICGAEAKWAEGTGIKGTPDAYEKTEYKCGAIYEKRGNGEPEPKYNELSGTYRCPLGDAVVEELRAHAVDLQSAVDEFNKQASQALAQRDSANARADKDAEVGRALIHFPDYMTFEYDGVNKVFIVFSFEPDTEGEQVFEGKTPRDALMSAGLIKPSFDAGGDKANEEGK